MPGLGLDGMPPGLAWVVLIVLGICVVLAATSAVFCRFDPDGGHKRDATDQLRDQLRDQLLARQDPRSLD